MQDDVCRERLGSEVVPVHGGAPIRVLRLIARLNVGGPARHAVILDRGLRTSGFDTLLVHGAIGPGEGSLEDLAQDAEIPTHYLPSLGRRLRPFDDVRAFGAVLRLLWRRRPHIVHTHTAKAGAIGRVAAAVYNVTRARARRCAVLHTYHGHVFSGYFGPIGSTAARLTERALAHLTDVIITISAGQRDDIVGRFGVASLSRTVMIRLGLELGPLLTRDQVPRHSRSVLGFGRSDYIVGYVGRLAPIKSVATLIEAVVRVARQNPRVKLVIAGDGEERPRLEALVRESGLSDSVRFLGWQRDLPSLYAALDLFVLSSLSEGTPVSLIEAMAAGIPVVATAVGGVPDVIADGITGVLCPPADPGALCHAILRCVDDPAASTARAQAARTAVEQHYDPTRLVRDVSTLYRRALASKRGGVMDDHWLERPITPGTSGPS